MSPSSFLRFLLLLVKDVLLDLQLLIDEAFGAFGVVAGDEELVEDEIGLNGPEGTLWKLKMRSSSQTLPKYLSRI